MQGLVTGSIPEQRELADGNGMFPLTLIPEPGSSPKIDEFAASLKRQSAELRALALKHGGVLLRDCPIRGADDFAKVSLALECEGYSYIGGAAPRTEIVPGVVFTSNESPPDQAIPFHHELAQSPTPPAYILFCCERAAAEGGATPIIPSGEVADFFESKFPEFAKRVAELGVSYIRTVPEVTDMTSAQGRSWKETYAVSSREEAELAMQKQGTSFTWLPNGDCRTVTKVLPALVTDSRTGKRMFFNSMVAAFTGWNDARNEGRKAVVLGDGSPIEEAAMDAVAAFMKEKRVAFKWHVGDVIILDNTTTMHSRDTFTPPRRVLASLCGPPRRGEAEEAAGEQQEKKRARLEQQRPIASPARVGI